MLVNSSSLSSARHLLRNLLSIVVRGLRARFSVTIDKLLAQNFIVLLFTLPERVSISRGCSSNSYPNLVFENRYQAVEFLQGCRRIIRRRSNFAFASEGALHARSFIPSMSFSCFRDRCESSFRASNGAGRCRAPQSREEEQGGRAVEIERERDRQRERRGKDAAFQY